MKNKTQTQRARARARARETEEMFFFFEREEMREEMRQYGKYALCVGSLNVEVLGK